MRIKTIMVSMVAVILTSSALPLLPAASAAVWGADPFSDMDTFDTGMDGWSYGDGAGWAPGGSGTPPPGHDGSPYVSFPLGSGFMTRSMGLVSRTDVILEFQFWFPCVMPCQGGASFLPVVYGGAMTPNQIADGYSFYIDSWPGGHPQIVVNCCAVVGWYDQAFTIQPNTLYQMKFVVAGHFLYGYVDGILRASAEQSRYITPINSFDPATSFLTTPFDLQGGPPNIIGFYNLGSPVGVDKVKITRNTIYVQDQNDKVSLFQQAGRVDGNGNACNAGTPAWVAPNEILLSDCAQAIRFQNSNFQFSDFTLEFDFRYKAAIQGPATPSLDIHFGGSPLATDIPNAGVIFMIDLLDPVPTPIYFFRNCNSLNYCTGVGETAPQYPDPLFSSLAQSPTVHHAKLVRAGSYVYMHLDGFQVADAQVGDWLTGNQVTIATDQFHKHAGDGVWVDNIAFAIKGQGDDFQSAALQQGWTVSHGSVTFPVVGGDTKLSLKYGPLPAFDHNTVSISPPPYIGYSGWRFQANAKMVSTQVGGVTPKGGLIVSKTPAGWTQFDFGGTVPGFYVYTGNENCAVECGTPVGQDEFEGYYSWGGVGASHSVAVSVLRYPNSDRYRLMGWIDNELVASLDTTSLPYGTFGVVNEELTEIQFDDVLVQMDTDADGEIDAAEINGHQVVRGSAIYAVGDIGQYFIQMPSGAGSVLPVLVAKAPRGGGFTMVLYQQAANGARGQGVAIQTKTFQGTGVYSLYAFNLLAKNGGPLYFDLKFGAKDFDTDIRVAAFGLVSPDWGGKRVAFIVSGDAEGQAGGVMLDYPVAQSDLTYQTESSRETLEWDLYDFDSDGMGDWREGRMLLRTTVKFGFLHDTSWGSSTVDTVTWAGLRYNCKTTQANPPTCAVSPAGYNVNAPLLAKLADGAELRGQRLGGAQFSSYLVFRDHNHAANAGGSFYVYLPVAAGSLQASDWLLDDSMAPAFENSRQIYGAFDGTVTNQRWAIFENSPDGAVWGTWILLDKVRTMLVQDFGYVERTNNLTNPDASGLDVYSDHILTAFYDGTDGPLAGVYPSNVDFTDSEASVGALFQGLAPYVGRDDTVLVFVFEHGDVDGDTQSAHYGETFTKCLYPNHNENDPCIYESDWASNLAAFSRPLNIVFSPASSHGGGLLDSVSAPWRLVMSHAKQDEPGRFTDNKKSSNGNTVCEDETCDADADTEISAMPEVSYYVYGAFKRKTIFENDVFTYQWVTADDNHNGIVSWWEAWGYGRDHHSWRSGVWSSTYWITPQLDDDGVDAANAPNGYDGIWSQSLYL